MCIPGVTPVRGGERHILVFSNINKPKGQIYYVHAQAR